MSLDSDAPAARPGRRWAGTATALALAGSCAAVLAAAAVRARPAPPTHLVVAPERTEAPRPDPHVLRVCADPNNLPFSNAAGEGFENELARLAARDLGRRVEYYWQPQRRGFLRTTLRARLCDVIVGVPSSIERVRVTRPYYRSTYVFVSRRDRHLRLRSFDDDRLAALRIGVQLTGDDYDNPPALQALAERHLVDNVRPFLVYGDYSRPDPTRAIVDGVAARTVDVAVAWGPLAGYFAAREPVPLELTPVSPLPADRHLPFVFDISMAVRRDDGALGDALDAVIARRAADIRALLRRYGVPLAAGGAPRTQGGTTS